MTPRPLSGSSSKAIWQQWAHEQILSLIPRMSPGILTDFTTRGTFRRIGRGLQMTQSSGVIFSQFSFAILNRITYRGGGSTVTEFVSPSATGTVNCLINGRVLEGFALDGFHTRDEAIASIVPIPTTCTVVSGFNRATFWDHGSPGGPDFVPPTIEIPARGSVTFDIPANAPSEGQSAAFKSYQWNLRTT